MKFHPHFQPIIKTDTGEVHGHESLFRLHGMLGFPLQLFTAWEARGDVAMIDALFVRCLVRMGEAGQLPPRLVGVNASARTIANNSRGYFKALEALQRHVPRLVVELTETYPVEDVGQLAEFSRQCRNAGIDFGLDDCTPGHQFAERKFIETIQPRFIKTDLSLIRRAASGDLRPLMEVLDVAKAYDLLTVVEGIDDDDKLQIVRESGSKFWQGFLGGMPAPFHMRASPGEQQTVMTGTKLPQEARSAVVQFAQKLPLEMPTVACRLEAV